MIKTFLVEAARCDSCRENPTLCLSIYHSEDKADYSRICKNCLNNLFRMIEDFSLEYEDGLIAKNEY